MTWLTLGIILTLIGVRRLYKSSLLRVFYQKVENGKNSEYKKIIGTVICDAYDASDMADSIRPVTPIVEYEVNGEKYETQNRRLSVGAELPVGTKVYVWYKKNNPKQAVLGTELESHLSERFISFILITFGLVFIIIGI